MNLPLSLAPVILLSLAGPALALQGFGPQQLIDDTIPHPWKVCAGDVDQDGDVDVVVYTSDGTLGEGIWWYENAGGGNFVAVHSVASGVAASDGLKLIDMDGDLDLDVFRASNTSMSWIENLGGVFGSEHLITSAVVDLRESDAFDVDGDGDVDAFSAEGTPDRIAWYENLGGSWGPQIEIASWHYGAYMVRSGDLDGDGDGDVIYHLGHIYNGGELSWRRFEGGAFSGGGLISTGITNVTDLAIADLDDDGDQDFGLIMYHGHVLLYENTDGLGDFDGVFVNYNAHGAVSLEIVDLNGDDLPDLLIATELIDEMIMWQENLGGFNFGPEQVIATGASLVLDPRGVAAGDFDGDGDADAVSVAVGDDKIAWYANEVPTATGSDECAQAYAIVGPGLFAYDNENATTGSEGQNESLCFAFGTSNIAHDVWFEWTANTNGTVTVTTCGYTSVDTKLAAFPGAGCPSDGTAIACNDDTCGLQSSISFPAGTGETFMLQVGTFVGASGGNGHFEINFSGGGDPGTWFCDCSTSGPCGNDGAISTGCANSVSTAGAFLWASGTATVGASDSLVLEAFTMPPNQFMIFFQGDTALNGGNGVPFGAGLRCAGQNVIRINTPTMTDGGGSADTSGITISAQGGAVPGETKHYQGWYRDPGGPCGASFNLTNGLSVTWL
jgi:hypothetical protein